MSMLNVQNLPFWITRNRFSGVFHVHFLHVICAIFLEVNVLEIYLLWTGLFFLDKTDKQIKFQ